MLQDVQRLSIGDQKIWDDEVIHYYLMNSSMQYDFWLSVNPSEVLQLVNSNELQVMACPKIDLEEEEWQVRPYYSTKELLIKYAYIVDDLLDDALDSCKDYVDYQFLVRPHIHNLMYLSKKYNQNALRCGYIRNVIERYHMVVDGLRQTQTLVIAV